jgi:hypothetical protein
VTTVLAWGVKQSLIGYVTHAPGGQLLSSPDVLWEDGTFRFPLAGSAPDAPEAAAAPEADDGEYGFDGVVRFHGHFGSLVAELGALRIARGEAGWTLSFAGGDGRVEGFTLDGEPAESGGSADGDPRRLSWEKVALTAAGSEVFGDHYPPGTLFDPLAIVF